jgi:hypothetical protein
MAKKENILSQKSDNIFNKEERSLKQDIIFFKEEILTQMNNFEKNLAQQKDEINSKINNKFILYEDTILKLNNNFSEIKKKIDINQYIKEQIDAWSIFKNEISKISTENGIKITLLEKDTNNNIFRIDKLLNNSILYPRVIGQSAKFKNFHEYIDYTLTQLSSIDIFRGRIEFDLKSFKTKVDKIIQGLKLKLECVVQDVRQIVKNGIKENEIILKDYIAGQVYDLLMKNNELEKKFEKKFEDLNLELKAFDEKIALTNEKIDLNDLNKEKKNIYYDIKECKNKENELDKRINDLEKYKENEEREKFWKKLDFKKRKKDENIMTLIPDDNQNFNYMNRINDIENFKTNANYFLQKDEYKPPTINIENNNNINLEKNKNDNNIIRKNKTSANDIKQSTINLNNDDDKNIENKKINTIPDEDMINIDPKNKLISKNGQKEKKSFKSLYKLRISLKDINAQFNFGNLNNNDKKNKIFKDEFSQFIPISNPIYNNQINFNEIFSYNYKNEFQKFLITKKIKSPVHINQKEIKFLYDTEPKNKNNDIINTERKINKKNKNKKNEEQVKTWERLLSSNIKKKSELNIFDTYLINYKNYKKNKILNSLRASKSTKNFFSKFHKS